MVLFSRSFIRKRAISLATTTSVAAVSLIMAHEPTSARRMRTVSPIQYVADWQGHSDDAPFLSQNETAMRKMMAGMAVKATGNVDRDFVAMMVPHHQGAVDMARAELRYGHNEVLLRLARKIVDDQEQEIAVMHAAIDGEPSSPTRGSAAPHDGVVGQTGMNGMRMSQ